MAMSQADMVRAELAHSGMLFDFQDRERSDEDRQREREVAQKARERDRESRAYEEGQRALDEARYDRAIDRFNDVVTQKGTRVEAALYWKAFAQDRQGQRAEALATIGALTRDYPNSRYLQQAKVLEAEVRRNAGQPVRPQDQADEDLKLMALNALQNSAPEQAVPMLEKLLQGTASPKLKSRALFVLAQSDAPQAREVLKGIARGNSTPELQTRAISYLGTQGGAESRTLLAEIYGSSTDVDVKKRILRAFMTGGDKARLVSAAQTEQNPELRVEAVRMLGAMGAHDELSQLYQKETAVDIKRQVIRAMFTGGHTTKMIELAKSEPNAELRREAVRSLGMMDSKETAATLIEIYQREKDLAVKKAVVQGLFQQDDATSLVALARKEEDPALKRDIVSRLSTMGDNKIATAYMLELLNSK
jgi:HEAT repeat protein